MNALTANWTEIPANFDAARRKWEYGHGASAILTLVALILILYAMLSDVRERDRTSRRA